MAAWPQNDTIGKHTSALVIAKHGGKEFLQNDSFLRISGLIF